MMKTFIGDAIVYLYEEYKKAKEHEWVNKPVSFALYQTWKTFDHIEKSRNGENNEYKD